MYFSYAAFNKSRYSEMQFLKYYFKITDLLDDIVFSKSVILS